MTTIRRVLFASTLGAAVLAGGAARAQDVTDPYVPPPEEPPPMTISPSGGSAPTVSPSGTPAQGRGGPAPAEGQTQPGQAPAGGAPAEGGAADWYDYYGDSAPADDERDRFIGVPPEVHVVRSGDTLWDICSFYFNNPWEWPKIWSYNPTITNPHWIYPGDLVRLYPAGAGPVQATPTGPTEPTGEPTPRMARAAGPRTVDLRQLAFVDNEDLKFHGTIAGSPEEKVMLSTGDEIFIDYPEGKPPQVGRRYAIYSEARQVKHPTSKAVVGSYVLLKGEVHIVEVKKGKRARGVITYSNDVIERGLRVGDVKRQYREIAPRAPERDLEGVIVAMLGTDQVIGENQIVFIDRGAEDGVRVGNQLRVIRRGDAYEPRMGPSSAAGRDDRRFPEDVIGTILVVETAPRTSVGLVVEARLELEPGDHVVMRKPR